MYKKSICLDMHYHILAVPADTEVSSKMTLECNFIHGE